MKNRLDALVTAVLAVAAILATGTFAYRTFFPSAAVTIVRGDPPRKMAEWDSVFALGRRVAGDQNSLATAVVFADLECPACRDFHINTLRRAEAKHGNKLQVLYIHYPLSYHRQALPAARATECVAAVSDVGKWIDLLFTKQDSLGLKTYGAFAHDIGIPDTSRINSCASNADTDARIAAGSALGNKVGVSGTPTVVLNGWIFSTIPGESVIDSAVQTAQRLGTK